MFCRLTPGLPSTATGAAAASIVCVLGRWRRCRAQRQGVVGPEGALAAACAVHVRRPRSLFGSWRSGRRLNFRSQQIQLDNADVSTTRRALTAWSHRHGHLYPPDTSLRVPAQHGAGAAARGRAQSGVPGSECGGAARQRSTTEDERRRRSDEEEDGDMAPRSGDMPGSGLVVMTRKRADI